MNTRLIALTAIMSPLAITVLMGATPKQDLTEGKPAVQDAVVDFGHPVHPWPPAPAHHTLYPDDVTIFKGETVTFAMHGMGHGIAIYPVSKKSATLDIWEAL